MFFRRIEDETQHLVSLSAFYMDPFETTQADDVSAWLEKNGILP